MSQENAQSGMGFAFSDHARITMKASAGILTDRQMELVIRSNYSQDIAHQQDSKVHFDNCCFEEGAAYVMEEWHNIETEMDPYSDNALITFGRLLHTVQDFYSHSNWVELNQFVNPIPIWDLNVNSLPAGIVSGTWAIGTPKRCSDQAPTHRQLNKDDLNSEEGKKIVASGPNQGKPLFSLAQDAAIRATSEQFKRLQNINKIQRS